MYLNSKEDAINFAYSLMKADRIGVVFDLNSTRVLGQFVVNGYNCHIRLNEKIMLANKDTYYLTIIHEVAHYFTYVHYGRSVRPRGREWKYFATKLGGVPERLNTISDTSLVKKQKNYIRYSCQCKEHYISPLLHSRIQQGSTRICVQCKKRLVLAK